MSGVIMVLLQSITQTVVSADVLCLTVISVMCVVVSVDVLSKDSGECSICLDELQQGETIARLACLCVYHKR